MINNISDSDESLVNLRDIKPYNFEPLVNKVTYRNNYEELATASAYVYLEQPHLAMIPAHGPHCICSGISLIDKSSNSPILSQNFI